MNNPTNYTADNLITLRAAAAIELRSFLREEEAHYAAGIRGGFLADSAMDAVRWTSGRNYTVTCGSIMGGEGYRCIVRVEDEDEVEDFILTPRFSDRPWIPSGWSIKPDMLVRKWAVA